MKSSVLSSQPVPLAVVRDILVAMKASGELNFRASRTEEYASQMVKLSGKSALEIVAKLELLAIPRFRAEYAVKLVDLLPKTEDEVKAVLQSLNAVVTKENIQKIFEVMNFEKS